MQAASFTSSNEKINNWVMSEARISLYEKSSATLQNRMQEP